MVIDALSELDWGSSAPRGTRELRRTYDDVIELLARSERDVDILIIPKVYGTRDVWFFETFVCSPCRRADW